MHARDTPIAPDAKGTMRVVADALWVVSFLVIWGGLVTLWNTWWTVLFLPLFVCHLGGLSEFVHQAVHRNLFARSRGWNRTLGRVAAALLGVDFDTYRTFHLRHHRYVNTPDDPELQLYGKPALLEIADGWKDLPGRTKLTRIFRLAKYVSEALSSFGSSLPFVRATQWAVPVAIVCAGYLEGLPWFLIPLKVLVSWYLPLLCLIFVDLAFAQSEHYATEMVEGTGAHGVVPHHVQYGLSWNLKVPTVIEFFLLRRNIHAEHHLSPGIHWTQAKDQGAGRMMSFKDYLKKLWQEGPRTYSPSPGG